MMCPQCNAELGEGAKACAACGWAASKKKIWVILGIVFGVLFLICCGIGTWFMFKMKGIAESMAKDMVPIQALVLRAQVAQYAQKHGKAPATLEEAAAEPLQGAKGEKIEIKVESNGMAADMWQRPFRFQANPDRSFEIRSAGVDGTFDNADDVVEKGTLDDDVRALEKEIVARFERMGKDMVRGLGIDLDKLEKKAREAKPEEGGGEGGAGEGGGK